MPDPTPLFVFLAGAFNVLWLTLYALVIRRGFLDRSFGIPAVALLVNLVWDFTGIFIQPNPPPQLYINGIYLLIDLVIVYHVLRFWRSDFPTIPPVQFYALYGLTLVLSFTLMQAFIIEYNDTLANRSAFIDTFINSALFIVMFYRRDDARGQSLYIGLCKWIGTSCMMLALLLYPWPGTENSVLLPTLYAGIFTLDAIYVVLIYRRLRALGLNPWQRF